MRNSMFDGVYNYNNFSDNEKEKENKVNTVSNVTPGYIESNQWTPEKLWELISRIIDKLELKRSDKTALTKAAKKAYDLEPSLTNFLKSIGLM